MMNRIEEFFYFKEGNPEIDTSTHAFNPSVIPVPMPDLGFKSLSILARMDQLSSARSVRMKPRPLITMRSRDNTARHR